MGRRTGLRFLSFVLHVSEAGEQHRRADGAAKNRGAHQNLSERRVQGTTLSDYGGRKESAIRNAVQRSGARGRI